MRVDSAAPEEVVRRARRAIARAGGLRQSYFTTFWMPRGAAPSCVLEELVVALWPLAGAQRSCAGAEWWLGRAYTTALPIDFHFDEDVKGGSSGVRHPLLSSVFFFNAVRGGQLAVTDQIAGSRSEPRPAVAARMEVVAPRRNRYVVFRGDRFHGVLDARGRVPTRSLPGPRGRLRVTLVVNFWRRRPSGVPLFVESGAYPALRRR